MHPVERESQSAPARLIAQLGDRLPYINFYRFCQLLEQSQPDKPVTGSTWQVRHEPVRFRPHPGMGFPASEIKGLSLNIRICRRRYASPLWGSTAWSPAADALYR
jgi:type VI secretion system protein ImpH